MALDGVEGGSKMGKYFVIGPDDTRTVDDFFLSNRRLMASEAFLFTGLVELVCWVRAEDSVLIDVGVKSGDVGEEDERGKVDP